MLAGKRCGIIVAPIAVCLLILLVPPSKAHAGKKAKPFDGSNGIYIESVKTYDEGAVEQLLAAAQQSLASITGFSQTSLNNQLGQIQGAVANQTALGVNLTGPGGTAPTTPTAASPGVPTMPNLSPSAVDVLNEQMQAQMQIINMQLLLRGSLNDQSAQGSIKLQRYRTTLGFPIYISVPAGFKYQEAVAEVEVTVCVPLTPSPPNTEDGKKDDDQSKLGPTLVTLLPQEKTYNVASYVSSAASIGTGVVAGVINGSAGFLRSRQTYYLVQDQDTLALQRPPRGTCVSGARPLTFAWQFRPVLGQKVVKDGLRQTFAQISLPKAENPAKLCPLPVTIRTGWRRYDRRTGRVGPVIDTFADSDSLILAKSFQDFPAPTQLRAYDNGDGNVTMIAKGGFKPGTRVRVGNTILAQSSPAPAVNTAAFEQNDKYIRFVSSALSLATEGAFLVNTDGTESEAKYPPNSGVPTEIDSDAAGCIVAPKSEQTTREQTTLEQLKNVSNQITKLIKQAPNNSVTELHNLNAALFSSQRLLATVLAQASLASIRPFDDTKSLLKIARPASPSEIHQEASLEVVVIGTKVYGLRDNPFLERSQDYESMVVPNDLLRANKQVTWFNIERALKTQIPIDFSSSGITGISDFALGPITAVSTSSTPSDKSTSDITVTTNTACGGTTSLTGKGLLTIANGTPAITSISPSSALQGTDAALTITTAFTSFAPGSQTQVYFSDPKITGPLPAPPAPPPPPIATALDRTHLQLTIHIPADAAIGQPNVTMPAPSQLLVGTALFSVQKAAALTPNPLSASAPQPSLTIQIAASANANTLFRTQPPTLKFAESSGITFDPNNLTVIDDLHLTVKVNIAADAPNGTSIFTITCGSQTLTGQFNVTSTAPTIVRIDPAAVKPGETYPNATITGANTCFSATAPPTPDVKFSNTAVTSSGVTVQSLTTISLTINVTATASSDASSGSNTKTGNVFAITGSSLTGLKIVLPPDVKVDVSDYGTLATFSLSDDQLKQYKSIVVDHDGERHVVALPADTAAASTKPTLKDQAAPIDINATTLTVTGKGMTSVVAVRYLDTSLPFTVASDTSLIIQKLPTLTAAGIELVFVYADRTLSPYKVPVQAPAPK